MADIKVHYKEHMGSDDFVCDMARVSFDKLASNYPKEKNDKLIKYLAKHNHWSPFGHPQITLQYNVPIFVARQEFKHVVGFVRNEVSRRYVDDEPTFYVPDSWRSRPDGSVKQGSGTGVVDTSEVWTSGYGGPQSLDMMLKMSEELQLCLYNEMLTRGIAPEQARIVLPQSMMTSYYVTGSLAAFARMVRQRKDPHSQKEIQDLAHMVDGIIRPLYPVSWSALVDD